jgi:acylpyruvate hydrolase
VLFLKPVTALVGPDEDIALPPVTTFLDYEAELAVVIGHGATVAAATCLNDGSARDLQPAELGGKPIIDRFSGKSLDRTGAIGPWLQLIDGAGDVGDVAITCRVNGEVVQSDRTSSMVHSVEALMAFIGARVALRPGDVIATGTPGGVGAARGVSLQTGDVVDVEIDGVGRLVNTVKATTPAPVG